MVPSESESPLLSIPRPPLRSLSHPATHFSRNLEIPPNPLHAIAPHFHIFIPLRSFFSPFCHVFAQTTCPSWCHAGDFFLGASDNSGVVPFTFSPHLLCTARTWPPHSVTVLYIYTVLLRRLQLGVSDKLPIDDPKSEAAPLALMKSTASKAGATL